MEIKNLILLFEIFGKEEVTFQNLKNIGTKCNDVIKQRVMQRMTAARWRQNIGEDYRKFGSGRETTHHLAPAL